MTENYTCPRCGAEVPEPPEVRIGRATTGPVLSEANAKVAECPQCKARLRRVIDAPDPSWQLEPGVQQPPWQRDA